MSKFNAFKGCWGFILKWSLRTYSDFTPPVNCIKTRAHWDFMCKNEL